MERDLPRRGTWPARCSLSSSGSRAKRHSGSGPSAQTSARSEPMASFPMLKTHIAALALAMSLVACSSPWLGADAKIHVSGKPAVIPSEQIAQLREMWSPESTSVARTSGFSESYWLSAMDLIARMKSASNASCKRLQLLAVAPRPATEFVLSNPGEDTKRTVTPTRMEEWKVDSCGVSSLVRVFDDKLKPDMKVGVSGLVAR